MGSLPADDATWENQDFITQQFPQLLLEDKKVAEEQGNVVTVAGEG